MIELKSRDTPQMREWKILYNALTKVKEDPSVENIQAAKDADATNGQIEAALEIANARKVL